MDIIPELKQKYTSETYVLTIEKYDSRYVPEGDLAIDERLEFTNLQEAIDYLVSKGFLKRDDLIKDETKS